MNLKRILIMIVGFMVIGSLIFAGGTKDKSKVKIGILQLVEHGALDAANKGFVDALAEAGYKDGENIIVDYQNAQGEQANCQTIAQKFINNRSDLILAIATPAAQAVANLTTSIPILVTAVTDPESAKLVKSNSMPGTNVSGTSDLTPVFAQIELLKKLVPYAKKVAFMYNSSEQNSIFQINLAKEAAKSLNLEWIDATVSNSNEIQQVAQSVIGKVQAFYVPTDNMVSAGLATVAMVSTPAGIPIICGEDGMFPRGGFATYGINYYELGKQTGRMAVRILRDGKKPAEMPIEYQEKGELAINQELIDVLNITIPTDLQ